MSEYYINNENNFVFDKQNNKIYLPNVFFNADLKNKNITIIQDPIIIKKLDFFLNTFDLDVLKKAFITAKKDYFIGDFIETDSNNIINKLNSYEKYLLDLLNFMILELNSLDKNSGIDIKNAYSILDIEHINFKNIIEAHNKLMKFLYKQANNKKNKSYKNIIEHHINNIKKQSNNLLSFNINDLRHENNITKNLVFMENSEKIFEKYIGNKIIKKQKLNLTYTSKTDLKELRIDSYFEINNIHYIIDFKLKHQCDDADLYKQIIYSAFLRDKKNLLVDNVNGIMIKPYCGNDIEIQKDRIYRFLDLKIFTINYPANRIFTHNHEKSQEEIANIVDNYIKNINKYKEFKLIIE